MDDISMDREGSTDSEPEVYQKAGQSLLDFIDRSPTPFHAVDELKRWLFENNFTELHEADAWSLARGGKYFVIRNDSSLIAFVVGEQAPEVSGMKIIGAHTDSPNLKIKPNPAYEKNGYVQLGVEVYGGVLLSTWTDRDLSLAGRVVLGGRGSRLESRLFRVNRPILRIPQLAIHLNREVNEKGLILNKQTHMAPVLALTNPELKSEAQLRDLVAGEMQCLPGEITSLELSLFDMQKGALGGAGKEFLFSARLDNLASCHAATTALLECESKEKATRVLAFYDNEEIGSETAQGGASPFLKDVLERIVMSRSPSREAYMRSVARSIFISADMAHAVHPNYSDMHDAQHLPLINGGPVIKTNASQRYATEGISSAFFESLCRRAGAPVQKFVMRSDLACGSTIGPVTAANLGIRTVDAGNPMLSMHSVREMAGSRDHWDMIRVLKELFRPDTELSLPSSEG